MKKTMFVLTLGLFFFSEVFGQLKIGDEYTKLPWREALKSNDNSTVKKHILNSVLVLSETPSGPGRATGFYLGLHQGRHLFMTNAHALSPQQCSKTTIRFITKGIGIGNANCESVLLHQFKNEMSDVTLFTVKESKLRDFAGEGLEIDFSIPSPGTLLTQYGFGKKRNRGAPSNDPLGDQYKFLGFMNMDSDCAVISAQGEKRTIIAENNRRIRNTISVGCDVTTGDSGSAILDRDTGKVVAILWGGGFAPTESSLRYGSAEIWSKIIGNRDDPRVWQNFAYAISMADLKQVVSPFL